MKRILALVLAALLCISGVACASTTVKAKTSLKSATDNKIDNIEMALKRINGYVIQPGAYFSFNDVIGPRTENHGYQEARNGRDVLVMGGGVSQVATTLYLALLELQAGIVYDDIKTYGSKEYKGDYVADRNFAIVTDYEDGQDFSFTNNFDDAIEIEMWIDGNNLRCSLTLPNSDYESLDESAHGWTGDSAPAGVHVLSSSRIYQDSKTTSNAMTKNIKRAASMLHGLVIPAGGEFSFNEAVGPRSQKYGYINAKNGRGAFVTGGAVAQVASALWLALKEMDGIYIVEMETYGEDYNQSYVKNAADAVVTDYGADKDFVFRNETGSDIAIAMFVDDDNLFCRIYQ